MSDAVDRHPVPSGATPTGADLVSLSDIFAALSDPTRLRIIYCILGRERSVGDIADELELSKPSVSQHLARLRLLRMVRVRKSGRRHLYQLDDAHVTTLLSTCLEHVQLG